MIHAYIVAARSFMGDVHSKEVVSGSLASFAVRLVGLGIVYVFALAVTRMFGADAYGSFALFLTVLQILAVVISLGFGTVLLRFSASCFASNDFVLLRDIYRKAISVVVPFGATVAVGFWFAAPYVAAHFFHKEGLAFPLQLAAVAGFLYALLTLHFESLRGLKRIVLYSFLQKGAVPAVGIVVIGIFVVAVERAPWVPIVAYAAGILVAAATAAGMFLRLTSSASAGAAHYLSYRKVFGMALPMLLTGSMYLVMQWTDTIMLGVFRPAAEVGIYNVAVNISFATSIVLSSINSIAAPKFSELYSGGHMADLRVIVHRTTWIIMLVSLVPLLTIFLFPGFILGVFGPAFVAGTGALLALTVGQFINAASGSVGYLLNMTGHEKVFQWIMLGAAVCNVVLNAILIPAYGIGGAAIASAVSVALWNAGGVLAVKRYLGFYTFAWPTYSN